MSEMKTSQKSAFQYQNRGFFVHPRTYVSRDGEYITMVLPGNIIVRKHANYFKSLLGIAYEPKTKPLAEEVSEKQPS